MLITFFAYTSFLFLLAASFFGYLIYRRDVYSVALPFIALHILFYYFPFFAYFDPSYPKEYSLFTFYDFYPDREFVALVLCLSSFCLLVFSSSFYIFSAKIRPINVNFQVPDFRVIRILLLVVILFFLLFLASFNFDNSFIYLFAPSRKALGLSGIERAFLSSIPLILALYLFHKPKPFLLFLVTLCSLMLIIFVLGQRRQIISLFAFATLFNYRFVVFNNVTSAKKFYLSLFSLSIILVPTTWYARVYFTRLNNSSPIQNLFDIRSPLELLFGSSTKGFQSQFLQLQMIKLDVIEYLDSLFFIFTAVIPRFMFDDKYMSIPAKIAKHFQTNGSTSNFFMSETLTNFWIFSPLVMVVFSLTLAFIDRLKYKGNFQFVFFLFFYTNSVQLFKNGWSSTIVFSGFFALLLFLFYYSKGVSK